MSYLLVFIFTAALAPSEYDNGVFAGKKPDTFAIYH